MMAMSSAEQALAWAIEQHGSQTYGDEPYEVHLRAVFDLVREAGGSEVAVMAAALHDIVEDVAEVTAEDVESRFGAEVARVVRALTKPPRGTPSRVEVYLRAIKDAGPDAVLVKVADRVANVRASAAGPTADARLLEKYRGEAPTFRALLQEGAEHAALWSELDALLSVVSEEERP